MKNNDNKYERKGRILLSPHGGKHITVPLRQQVLENIHLAK
jgi:hypothetical protein